MFWSLIIPKYFTLLDLSIGSPAMLILTVTFSLLSPENIRSFVFETLRDNRDI